MKPQIFKFHKTARPARVILFGLATIALASAAVLPLVVPPTAAAQSTQPVKPVAYKIDLSHAGVYFKISHLGMSYTYGRFNKFSGDFTLAGADSKFNMKIAADSIDTAFKKRDGHLRSSDYFNVKQFPNITFATTGVKIKTEDGKETYHVTGDLTLLGVTQSITIPFTKVGEGKDPWGKYRAGFDTTFTIKRSAFGMTEGLPGVGDEVTLMISFEGLRK